VPVVRHTWLVASAFALVVTRSAAAQTEPAPAVTPAPAVAPAPATAPAPAAAPATAPHEETNEEWAARQNRRDREREEDDTPAPTRTHRGGSGFHGALQIHGSRRSLMGIGLWGYGGGGAIGGDVSETVGVYTDADFEIGKTTFGLGTFYGRFGLRGEVIVDRFRVGAGPQIQYFAISRASRNETIDSFGIGIYLLASFDLVTVGKGQGLYLGLRLDADWFAHAHIFGAQVPLGFRF
jgi:hypothetical protein